MNNRAVMRMLDFEELENDPHYAAALKSCRIHSAIKRMPPRSMLGDTPFAAGEVSSIYGKPGATKSVFAIDTACRLACGMDSSGNKNGMRHGVVYVAAERSAQVIRRVEAFRQHHGVDPFDSLIVYDRPIDLAVSSNHLAAIIKAAGDKTWLSTNRENGYDIDYVVIDTIAAAMSEPTSNTTATNAAAHNMMQAAKISGAHVCFIHHPPIADAGRLSGGHFTGAADVTVIIEKSKSGLSTAKVVKDNFTSDDVEASISYRTIGVDVETLDGSTSEAVLVFERPDPLMRKSASKHTARTIEAFEVFCRLAEAGPVSESAWLAEMEAADSKATPQTVRARRDRARDSLLASGDIEKCDDGYKITDKQGSQNDTF